MGSGILCEILVGPRAGELEFLGDAAWEMARLGFVRIVGV